MPVFPLTGAGVAVLIAGFANSRTVITEIPGPAFRKFPDSSGKGESWSLPAMSRLLCRSWKRPEGSMPRCKQARRMTVQDIRSILRLTHQQGLSIREIGLRLKLSKTTVATYLFRARKVGLNCWPLPPGRDDDATLGLCIRPSSCAHGLFRSLRPHVAAL